MEHKKKKQKEKRKRKKKKKKTYVYIYIKKKTYVPGRFVVGNPALALAPSLVHVGPR
jgi:hypothetical protein